MTTIQMVGAGLFAVALVHTFSTKFFERMAHRRPDHAGIWHLLGEVEVVFGFWAMVLVVAMMATQGREAATAYLDSRNFTEPMFVFAIMVIAGSRAVLQMARDWSTRSRASSRCRGHGLLLRGAVVRAPAGLAHHRAGGDDAGGADARDRIFSVGGVSQKLKYATLGVLFVNISIGGTLTPFAAPPVLMVAAKWNWDVWHMLAHFGWKAAMAVLVNALVTAWCSGANWR
jgi:hypothetical protein